MKNIIITGATSGIGEATARLLASQGHRLLLLARSKEKLSALKKELGDDVHFAECDVREYSQLERASDIAMKTWGKVDALINNAGLGYFDTVAGGKIEEWTEMVDTNIKGMLHGIHVFLPHLIASSGQIINLGSVASHQVFPNSGIYCATKHAVFAISESLRLELADKIRVTTISPGSVNTPFIGKTTNPDMLSNYKDYFAAGLTPEVVAQQISHALNAPSGSVISEIIIRPARNVK